MSMSKRSRFSCHVFRIVRGSENSKTVETRHRENQNREQEKEKRERNGVRADWGIVSVYGWCGSNTLSWMTFFVSSSIDAILLTLTFTFTTTKTTTTKMPTTTLTTFSSWERDIYVQTSSFNLLSKTPNAPTSNLPPWIVTKRSLFNKITFFFCGLRKITPFF